MYVTPWTEILVIWNQQSLWREYGISLIFNRSQITLDKRGKSASNYKTGAWLKIEIFFSVGAIYSELAQYSVVHFLRVTTTGFIRHLHLWFWELNSYVKGVWYPKICRSSWKIPFHGNTRIKTIKHFLKWHWTPFFPLNQIYLLFGAFGRKKFWICSLEVTVPRPSGTLETLETSAFESLYGG